MSFGFGSNIISGISNFNNTETIRGPPGPRGISLENVTSSQATGSDNVSLNFILTSGETKTVQFTASADHIITGGTFDTIYANQLYTSNANLSAGPVTVTNINGTNFSNLASDFVTLQYSYNSTVNQSVQTGADVNFGDVTCENVYASVITADIVNASVFNAVTTNEFLVSDKYILGCAAPTGPTGSWNLDGPTGSNDGAIVGFASGYNTAVGFQYVYATNRFDLLADRLDIGYLKLIKTEPSTAVQYLTIIGKDDPVISGKMYIGNGTGKCFYFASHDGSTSTNLICIDDTGNFTTKSKIGINSATTEWDPTRWLEIRDATEANIGFVAGSGTHDADILLNNSAGSFDMRTSTATPIRIRPNTNSNSNYVYFDTAGRMGLNCVPNSAYILDSLGNQRIHSTTGDSSLTISNDYLSSTNVVQMIVKSGSANKYLKFVNSSNLPNATDLLYAFTNYSSVESFQLRNSYAAFVASKVAISDSSIGNFTPTGNLHVKANGASIYLESPSGNPGFIFQGPGSSGSSAQFYLDSSNNYFVSNFHNNKPIVFQITYNSSIINAMRVEADSSQSILFGQNSRPSTGSYVYNTGSIFPNGDIKLGSSFNTYRSIIMGSGNSASFIFTRFANIGDSIAISHNWTYDSNGSERIPNSGLECNAVVVGTKIRFYTSSSIGTTPTINFNMYGKRFAINRGDSVGDGFIDIQGDGSTSNFIIKDGAGQNRYVYTSSYQYAVRNPSNRLMYLQEFGGVSSEYFNTFRSGWDRLYAPGADVASGTPIWQQPSDTSESIQTTQKMHIGAMSNVTSGYQAEITGNLKVNGNILASGSSIVSSPGIFSAPDASLIYTAYLISGAGDTYPLYFVTIYGNASFAASETQTINFPNSFRAATDLTSKIVCTFAPIETNNLAAIKFKDRTASSVKIECIDPLDGTQIAYQISFFAKQTTWSYS